MLTFGAFLRGRREARGMSPAEVAAECVRRHPLVRGITRVTVAEWEAERASRVPSPGQLEAMADVLRMSKAHRLEALRLAKVREEEITRRKDAA